MPLKPGEIEASLGLVIDTFKEFRDELLNHYGTIEHLSKADNSPVTELDVKIETTVKERLAEHYPHIGFHGEETDDTVGTSNATWIVDPIDGTSSFIHGLPFCTNMAGLVVDGEIVAAAIYQFATDELYTALKGQGAYKNGERIEIRDTPLNDSLVYTGAFAYKNIHPVLAPYSVGMYAPLGASGYEFICLANGNIQGVMKLGSGSQVHDIVPGALIAAEAGAQLLSFEVDRYVHTTRQMVACTPTLADAIKKHHSEIAVILANK